ncbi:MAG: GNAT family N-acetyltransferase [Lachnospiraceae bacterium]|nr:GNAT family N-acetyltransferase [Lachnospiraceae bacterium]
MKDKIIIQRCTLENAPKLALLNKQLIDDEKSNNTMSISELEERMRGFILSEYDAYFFKVQDNIVGYALVKNTCSPLYLRQFLIDKNYRKLHYGTIAFHTLLEFLDVNTMDIEVLPWNEPGIRFWESLGFREISKYMRL